MSISEISKYENVPTYRTLHKLSEQEKQNGGIFNKKLDTANGSKVVTYKDFNGDGFITENEIYKIEDYGCYKSAKGGTVTMIKEKIDNDGDGKADLYTMTRVKNGKVIDKKCLPLEWAEKLVQEARSVWAQEIEFSSEDFE